MARCATSAKRRPPARTRSVVVSSARFLLRCCARKRATRCCGVSVGCNGGSDEGDVWDVKLGDCEDIDGDVDVNRVKVSLGGFLDILRRQIVLDIWSLSRRGLVGRYRDSTIVVSMSWAGWLMVHNRIEILAGSS